MQWDDDVGAAGLMDMALWTFESDTLVFVELALAVRMPSRGAKHMMR